MDSGALAITMVAMINIIMATICDDDVREAFTKSGRWKGIGCIPCAHQESKIECTDARAFATFSVRSVCAVRVSNLVRHSKMQCYNEEPARPLHG